MCSLRHIEKEILEWNWQFEFIMCRMDLLEAGIKLIANNEIGKQGEAGRDGSEEKKEWLGVTPKTTATSSAEWRAHKMWQRSKLIIANLCATPEPEWSNDGARVVPFARCHISRMPPSASSSSLAHPTASFAKCENREFSQYTDATRQMRSSAAVWGIVLSRPNACKCRRRAETIVNSIRKWMNSISTREHLRVRARVCVWRGLVAMM